MLKREVRCNYELKDSVSVISLEFKTSCCNGKFESKRENFDFKP